MDEANPFAPPDEQAQLQLPRSEAAVPDADEVRAAIARLDQHLQDPEQVAADRSASGRRLRTITIVMMVLTLASGALLAGGLTGGPDQRLWTGFGIVFVIVFVVIGLFTLIGDLMLKPRDQATTPEAAMRLWLSAMRIGRTGHVYAALCPTARETPAKAPDIKPVVTGFLEYRLDSPKGVGKWLKSFARPGYGHVRWMKVRSLRVTESGADVATVEMKVFFRSFPNWANILSVVLFLILRLIGLIIAAVLWYTNRRECTVEFSKVLIRGRDGLWYVLDSGIGGRQGESRARLRGKAANRATAQAAVDSEPLAQKAR